MKKVLILFTILFFVCDMMCAQDIIVKNDGSVINAYRTDYKGQFIYYQTEDSDTVPILRLKKEDVLVIRLADGTAVTPNFVPAQTNDQQTSQQSQAIVERDFPDIDLTNYHGFLLDKGNCVYVTYNSKVDYELAAAQAIKQSIEDNGLWKVVDKPSQAHFVLQYSVSLQGKDFARLYFRPRDNYEQIPYFNTWSGVDSNTKYFLCGGEYVIEETDDNINAAQNIIVHLLLDYKTNLESRDFIESVKAGKVIKTKGNKEKWYVVDFVTVRQEAKPAQIKSLHDLFYR